MAWRGYGKRKIVVNILRSKFTALRGIIENGKHREWELKQELCTTPTGEKFMGWVVYETVEL